MKRRYLALWFPFLPTDRLRIEQAERYERPHDAASGPPWVLVSKVRGALRLEAVDAVAQALGLTPGMTLADARAVQPGLAVADANKTADRHYLQRLTRRCIVWSPLVSPAPPDGIVLDIAGVSHLFGGEAGLIAQIKEVMGLIGMTVRLAPAFTSEAAQALARHARLPVEDEREAILALPVCAMGLDAAFSTALRRAGLKTVGHVATQSPAVVAARFGLKTVTALRLLLGEERAPIKPLSSSAPLHFERRFAEPIALQATIAACFCDLLDEAVQVLEQRDLGGRRFALTLFRSDGAHHRLGIETGRPTRDVALVLRLFDERIAALADPLDPGFGYDRITLFLPLTQPLSASQLGFDSEGKAEAELAELIDRLSTRLGPQSLVRLIPQDSHLPELAQLSLPAIEMNIPVCWPALSKGEPPIRPLFLFDPPQPVEVIAEVPDGPPYHFRWRRNQHVVRLYEGPERIASEWWRRKGGEQAGQAGLTRDYYRVEDVRGRRYWIFRHGLYSEKPDPRQGPKWYIHGLFA